MILDPMNLTCTLAYHIPQTPHLTHAHFLLPSKKTSTIIHLIVHPHLTVESFDYDRDISILEFASTLIFVKADDHSTVG